MLLRRAEGGGDFVGFLIVCLPREGLQCRQISCGGRECAFALPLGPGGPAYVGPEDMSNGEESKKGVDLALVTVVKLSRFDKLRKKANLKGRPNWNFFKTMRFSIDARQDITLSTLTARFCKSERIHKFQVVETHKNCSKRPFRSPKAHSSIDA